MTEIQRRSLRTPDEHITYPFGATDEVHLGEAVVGRSRHQPGWRWSDHIRPIAGTSSCEIHHVGIVLSGRFAARLSDGEQVEFEPYDVYDIPPGHDGWVVGEEPAELLEWGGVHGWARPPAGERVLATILLTDIVDSTVTAERLGDTAWRRLLDEHYDLARHVLDRFRGREVATTGDGILAIFDGAERAVRAGIALTTAVDRIGLQVRAGVHTGEVEAVPGDVRGIAVHVAARIMSLARPGEVLVSGTTRELVEGRELSFADRGTHELKGVSGARAVFAAEHVGPE